MVAVGIDFVGGPVVHSQNNQMNWNQHWIDCLVVRQKIVVVKPIVAFQAERHKPNMVDS